MLGVNGIRGAWRWKGRLAALALLAVIALLWGWRTWQNRVFALRESEVLVESLTRALDFQVYASMRGISGLLDEMADGIDLQRWPEPRLEERYRERLAGFPEIRNMVVVDSAGAVRGAVLVPPGRPALAAAGPVGDREYFTALRAGFPGQRLVIGRPVVSRYSHLPSIPVARAIIGRNGAFAGAVLAGIDPGVFRDQVASVAVEPAGGASLIHADGTFLGRVPAHDAFLGRSVASSPLFRDFLTKAPSGIARFVSVADGNEKLVAFRTVQGFPLVATVGITVGTALAHWRQQTATEAAVLLVLAAALLAVAMLYDQRSEASRGLAEALAASHAELERQVEMRTAHLAASNAELEQFAYIASHDLQEPLRSISGFLQLLERRHPLDGEAREYVDFAVAAAQRMSTLINDLLAFSRVGRMDGPAEPCDASALAAAALTALASAVEEQKAKVAIAPLPQVWCRPAQLQSVFQNLLANAIKYRADSRPPLVTVAAEPMEDGMVRFSVRDNGIGIEPQYHERIFGIFQRLHPIGRYPGTGIGLSLCRKIVEHHGGRIWVDAAPAATPGTTICFTLKAVSGIRPG